MILTENYSQSERASSYAFIFCIRRLREWGLPVPSPVAMPALITKPVVDVEDRLWMEQFTGTGAVSLTIEPVPSVW
jgi:hypothetical protein